MQERERRVMEQDPYAVSAALGRTPLEACGPESVEESSPQEAPLRVIQEVSEVTRACSFPGALLNVLEVTSDYRSDKHCLAKAVAADPDLAKRIVSVARSPLYLTYGDRIDHCGLDTANLPNAIMKIGFAGVRNIAFTQSICVLARDSHRLGAEIVRHLIVTAEIARMLGWQEHVAVGEDAYLAALLHDYGKLALLRVLGTEYLNVATWCDAQGITTREAETDIVTPGQRHLRDHIHVGVEVLRDQGMPDAIIATTRHHHDNLRDHIDGWNSWSLTGIVMAADRLAYGVGQHDGLARGPLAVETNQELASLLGRAPEDLETLLQEALLRAKATLAAARIHPQTKVFTRIGELQRTMPAGLRSLPNLPQALSAEYSACLTIIDLARRSEHLEHDELRRSVAVEEDELGTLVERFIERGYLERGTLPDGTAIVTATGRLRNESPEGALTALGLSPEEWAAHQRAANASAAGHPGGDAGEAAA
jgi:HD-like signal output (HDOD) protein